MSGVWCIVLSTIPYWYNLYIVIVLERWNNHCVRKQINFLERVKLIILKDTSRKFEPLPDLRYYTEVSVKGKLRKLCKSDYGLEKIPSQSSIAEQIQRDFFMRKEQLMKGYIFGIPIHSAKGDANMKIPKNIRLKGEQGNCQLWSHLGIITNEYGQTVNGVSLDENLILVIYVGGVS
jgi:hypothetical protein